MNIRSELRSELREVSVEEKVNLKKSTVDWKGLHFEVREASLLVLEKVYEKAYAHGKILPFKFNVWLVIYSTYVPETDILVFDEEDFDIIMNTPSLGYIDVLSKVVKVLTGTNIEEIELFMDIE